MRNELDLSVLGDSARNELPIATLRDNETEKQEEVNKLRELVEFARKAKEAEKYAGVQKWFIPGTVYGIEKLPKHKAFFDAGALYRQRYFSAANRVGKTLAACSEVAYHLTGLYPSWWKGKRFTGDIQVWCAGSTNETTRNILQKELLGDIGKLGTGLIPSNMILKTTSKTGVSNAFDTVVVKNCWGGESILRFKSYDQGRRAFEGEAVHVIALDEMPDMEVYSECVARTATTGGIVVVTATPLDGMTDLVLSFYSEADILPSDMVMPHVIQMAKDDYHAQQKEMEKRGEIVSKSKKAYKAVIVAGWDDAPWLDEETKLQILAATPPHLRSARSTGLPGDTGGQVFPINFDDIVVEPFSIPLHYRLINGLDPGYSSATGAVFGAIDPDTDTLYIYADYERGQAEPIIHAEAVKTKSRWKDAPVIWDYAGTGGKAEKDSTRTILRKHGLKLIDADKSLEAGIAAVWERMSTGKLKIFKTCKILLRELATYHRDSNNKIVRENNHCLHPDTIVHTSRGEFKIVDLVGTSGDVLTFGGTYTSYFNVRKTGTDRSVVKVVFENGSTVTCTPDHRFLTDNGWVQAIDLVGRMVYNGIPQSIHLEEEECRTPSASQELSKSLMVKHIISVASTSKGKIKDFIGSCGNASGTLSKADTTSTTKTMTRQTTVLKISNWLKAALTSLITVFSTQPHQLRKHLLQRQSGIDLKKAVSGTKNTIRKIKMPSTKKLKEIVRSVGNYTRQVEKMLRQVFVATVANPLTDVRLGLTMKKEFALSAIQNSQSTSTHEHPRAQKNVLQRVLDVQKAGVSDVYCMTVPETECFAVNDGHLVHNCVDAARYVVMKIGMARCPSMGVAQQINDFGPVRGNVSGKKYW